MTEYYFITYAWRRLGETMWKYNNELISVHPIQWLIDVRSEPEHHRIIFYERISKIYYDEYKDEFG